MRERHCTYRARRTMNTHNSKFRWLTAHKASDPAANQVYALDIGYGQSQGWHRGSVTATAEPLEKHRLVWTSRRDEQGIDDTDTEIAPLWRDTTTPHGGDSRLKT